MPRWLFWPVCVFIIIVGAVASFAFIREGLPTQNTWHAGAVIGSLLVAVGWMVTSLTTITTKERDRTITVLASFGSDENSKSRGKIIDEYTNGPIGVPNTEEGYPEDHAVYAALYDEINEAEFIAMGALRGVYDYSMLRYELRDDFLDLYRTAAHYIKYVQDDDGDPEVWECFVKLCKKWGAKEPPLPSRPRDSVEESAVTNGLNPAP